MAKKEIVSEKASSDGNLVKPVAKFPIVGIGASAGGLAAFETFFSGMPKDKQTGMAFVLIQHLAPDHKSILNEIIQRYTSMKVYVVKNGMIVKPNCVYIIPPDRAMAIVNGTLLLTEPSEPRGHRFSIDSFFQSLAKERHELAIAIVLSGTGSDGTQGIKEIKAEGGLIIAQSIDTTEFDSMPRNAINTGLVDYVIRPELMANQIISYMEHALDSTLVASLPVTLKEGNILKKIFSELRSQTGHDFSQYKPLTMKRRIERRLAILQIESIDEYVRYLHQTPSEAEALLSDLLIGVTGFFRDPEAFSALKSQVLPIIFDEKTSNSVVRAWVPGCSTGEEAYSIAIIMKEYAELHTNNMKIQIFATDIDNRSIAKARAGIYSSGIAVDVSLDRLSRFFTTMPDGSSYRVNKSIRDMLVFSEQSVIKDPPFSKLDLISCRNMLIYMDKELQAKTIRIFHYALNPHGILFLGSSERVGDMEKQFTVLDRKNKLYQSKEVLPNTKIANLTKIIPRVRNEAKHSHRSKLSVARPDPSSLRELTEQALNNQLTQSGALVNDKGDILYLHGRTGIYLEMTPGLTGTFNILKMAREGLQRELTVALHKAVSTATSVYSPSLHIKTNGHFTTANLSVIPVLDTMGIGEGSFFLVVLQEAQPLESIEIKEQSVIKDLNKTVKPVISTRQEYQAKEAYYQAAIEELQTSIEELSSSNGEMQSVYEELQSTNEELETSKEELQSVNEELSTVNSELQSKVMDLSRVNNDMNNLLAGTDIATIFVDFNYNIVRFTPTATRITNLMICDIGRPVTQIVSNLTVYDQLASDLKEVLDTLVPKEVEVQTKVGNYYLMRLLPYRTVDNVIEGAVMTFVDITKMKRVEQALDALERSYFRIFETSKDGILILKAGTGKITMVNPHLVEMLGYTKEEFLKKSIWEIGLFEDIVASKNRFSTLQDNNSMRFEDMPLQSADGRKIEVEFIINAYTVNKEKFIQCNIRDITAHKLVQRSLQQCETSFQNTAAYGNREL